MATAASATPGPNRVPKADASGKLDLDWFDTASLFSAPNDVTFSVSDVSDVTKLFRVEVNGGMTTGKTLTLDTGAQTDNYSLTAPVLTANATIAVLEQPQTFTSTLAASNLSGTNTGDQTITLMGDVTGSGTGTFAATISNSAVTTAKIATGAVTTNELGALAVTTAKIAATAVTATELASNAVTTAKINNDAVTNTKLANMAASTLKGRVTASTGDPEDMTGTQATTLLDVFTSGLKGLVPASGGGTTNFLRADGTWAAAGGGGGITGTLTSGRVPFADGASSVTDSAKFTFDASTGLVINLASSGADNVTIGSTAGDSLTSGARNVFLGTNAGTANSTGADNTVIGDRAYTSGTSSSNVVIGALAGATMSSASNNVVIGVSADMSAGSITNSTVIGASAFVSSSQCIAIGTSATASGTGTMVVGSTNCAISNAYIGKGSTNATPAAFTLNATGASGTNISGAVFNIAGGKSTGTGTGGSVVIQTTPSGSSGSTQNTLTDRITITGPGNVVVGTAALATNATDGFLYVPTCAGTPTGTPTTFTGRAPIVIDSTNNKLYFYSGGAWRDAGP